ncbi:hypothetical protein BC939DRAFT_435601 [Gamsiella multidivaricata]|uniref:uncharacterized protein n=1 Tax=Gamsiella multidivaricata TaxID=101098 RepID=UPI00221E9F41|nr:uncharacterized protein BC939DRAFT_435601 [Gamsiella multidivaricata]KAI7832478.1 hypothetical protein BC939DRAFT_435601 [Gamsiella multidivaricata]
MVAFAPDDQRARASIQRRDGISSRSILSVHVSLRTHVHPQDIYGGPSPEPAGSLPNPDLERNLL